MHLATALALPCQLGRLRRRFPAEAESAALGAALQAAAVLQGVPVRQYVSDNPPPCEPEVRDCGNCGAVP